MIVIPLVTALAGQFVGGFIGGYLGFAVTGAMVQFLGMAGGLAGGLLGSMLLQKNLAMSGTNANGYPLQGAAPGTTIPKVFGTVRLAGNMVLVKDLISYNISHKKRMLGIVTGRVNETRYRRSFLLALCEGPVRILAIWKGKERIGLNSVTVFSGDGNIGMESVIGESYTRYANICCVYFENYELGNGVAIPNFTFVVTSVTTGNYIYTITYAGGNFTITRRTDNLDGTFTTTATLAGVGNTQAIFEDGLSKIYTAEGTNLKKYNSDLTLDTTWQTDGVLSIGSAFTIVAVNKSDNQVYYVSGTTLYCLDSTGAELWNTALSNFNTITCVGCFDKDDNLLMNVGASTGPGWYLVQHFNHITGELIRYHIPAGATGNIVNAMTYNGYNDNIVVIGYITGQHSNQRIVSSSYDKQTNYWDKHIPFNSGGTLKCIYCSSIGDIYIGSSSDAITDWLHWLVIDFPVSFASLQVFTSGGDRKAELQTYDTVTFVGGYTVYEILTGRQGTGSVSYAVYTDSLDLLRGGTVTGSLTLAGDSKELIAGDVNPAEIIYTILTDTSLGNISTGMVDTTTYNATKAYCVANGIYISLALYNKTSIMDWLDVINSHFFGYTLFLDGLVYIGVFKEESPSFSITRDDITDQIMVKDKDRSETSNHIVVKYTDRNMHYQANASAVADDWVDQSLTGQTRDSVINLPGIMGHELAQKTADRYLAELMFRFSTFNVTTSYKKMTLKPGMVGTIEDKKRIINRKVRIISKQETEDGKNITLTVVEDGPHIYLQPNLNSSFNSRVEATTPLLRNPMIAMMETEEEEYVRICIAPRGDVNGWQLLISRDNVTYTTIDDNITCDALQSRNSNGITVTSIPSFPVLVYRPDDYVDVDIEDGQDIDSVSEEDFFAGKSLIKIGDEIIGFRTVTDISDPNYPNRWRISDLIRGMFNTVPVTHAIGEAYATLIENTRFYYEEGDIAQTLYFVAVPFYGTEIQPFYQCEPTPYTIEGLYKRPNPVSLVRIDKATGEGIIEYSGATFTLEWELGSKIGGYNTGGFNFDGTIWNWTAAREVSGEIPLWNDGVLYGASPVDPTITGVVLRFYDSLEVFLSERTVTGTPISETITNATDLAGGTVNYIGVIPISTYRTYFENKIMVTKI